MYSESLYTELKEIKEELQPKSLINVDKERFSESCEIEKKAVVKIVLEDKEVSEEKFYHGCLRKKPSELSKTKRPESPFTATGFNEEDFSKIFGKF